MRIAFDSRPATDPRGIGRYVRCLLAALRSTAGEHELVEQHRPRDVDAYTPRGSTAPPWSRAAHRW